MSEADLSAKRGCAADLVGYWQSLLRFYDPRGRSSRTEIIKLTVLPYLVFTVALFALGRVLPEPGEAIGTFAMWLIILVPFPAAAARRFHDMGKSGWLALPALGLSILAIWHRWTDLQSGLASEASPWSGQSELGFVYALIWLLLVTILMQPPRDAKNPYGPNPRPAPNVI